MTSGSDFSLTPPKADQPLPHHLRERLAALGAAIDGVLAIAVIALGVIRDGRRLGPLVAGEAPPRPFLFSLSPWVIIAAHVLGGALLLLRRRRPWMVAVLLAVLAVVVPVLAAPVMTYSVARYGRRIPVSLALAVLLVLGSLLGADLLPLMGSFSWARGDPYTILLLGALFTALGLYRRAATDLRVAVAAQVMQGAREQREHAAHERLRERTALAIELHDEVARHLSILTLLAAAPTTDDDAERGQLREHSRAASEALYELIRALTGPPVDSAPDVPVTTVAGAATARAALIALGGLPSVELELGDLTAAGDDDPAWPVLAAVAAEAVVNARRHAPDSAVQVAVSRIDTALQVVVTNTAGAGDGDTTGAHLGLASARARCEELGGSLDLRSMSDGGARLTARVPEASGPVP